MLQLFDKYFLIVVVIQGLIVGFFDSKKFSGSGDKSTAVKAKLIGRSMILLAIVLFVSARFA